MAPTQGGWQGGPLKKAATDTKANPHRSARDQNRANTTDTIRHQTTTDIRQQQTPDNNRYHTAGSGSERSHNFDKTPRSHLCCPTLQLFETQLLSRETTPQISENGKANLTENGPAANILVF